MKSNSLVKEQSSKKKDIQKAKGFSLGSKENNESKHVYTSKSLYIKKIKRSTKQGIKTVLISPLFHVLFKVLIGILLLGSLLYSAYNLIGGTFANEVVVSQSEIVARVKKLTPVPQEEPKEVVRVQDPELLKKQNSFYDDVKEGDYILMYSNLAIIYDLRSNSIVAIKRNDVSVPRF